MIPLSLLDGDTLVIDNSSLELFQTCPRSALYGLSLRRRPCGERSALRFGGIAHKVLETRYRTDTPMLEQTPMVQNDMIAVAEHEFKSYTPPEDDFRNLDRMIALIDAYGKQYPYEPFEIVRLPSGKPFIEVPFALPFGEIVVDDEFLVQELRLTPDGLVAHGEPTVKHIYTLKIVWSGRIDMVYTINNGIYVLDHKTASIATNMAEFEISHQFKGYEWAVETLLGQEVTATVVNRIVVRKPSRTGEAFTFERKVTATQRGLLREWRQDILHIIADYVEGVRRNYLPKHTQWCVGKFGTCPFHKVCMLGDEADALSPARMVMIDSGEYEENVWSPLAN